MLTIVVNISKHFPYGEISGEIVSTGQSSATNTSVAFKTTNFGFNSKVPFYYTVGLKFQFITK